MIRKKDYYFFEDCGNILNAYSCTNLIDNCTRARKKVQHCMGKPRIPFADNTSVKIGHCQNHKICSTLLRTAKILTRLRGWSGSLLLAIARDQMNTIV